MEGFCTPGGLRAQPSRDDCRVFVESLGSLDAEALTQELEAKMVRAPALSGTGAPGCVPVRRAVQPWGARLGASVAHAAVLLSSGGPSVCVCVCGVCVCVGESVGVGMAVCRGGRGCVPEPGYAVMLWGQTCELLWA